MFAPAIVAAAKLLPFGLTHRFMTWFNGESLELEEDEYEYEDEEGEYEDEQEEDPESRIRFKSDVNDDEEELGVTSLVAETEDGEEYADEVDGEVEDVAEDDEEYEEEEEEEAGPVVTAPAEPEPEPEPVAAAAPKPHFKLNQPKAKPKSDREIVMSQLNDADKVEPSADYDLPSLGMLKSGSNVSFEQQKREALEKAKVLEKTCTEFGYNVKVVEIETGPVIS